MTRVIKTLLTQYINNMQLTQQHNKSSTNILKQKKQLT